MSKNRNYHKKPVAAKDRFVGVRLDKESFSKVEEAAMAADLSISEYIRRVLMHRKITIKEEIVVEVPVIKELILRPGKDWRESEPDRPSFQRRRRAVTTDVQGNHEGIRRPVRHEV